MAKLQSGSPRRVSKLTNNDAHIGGSLAVGVEVQGNGALTQTTTAFFKLPVLTTAQRTALTGEGGMQVYDSTLGEEYTYRSGGWGTSSGTGVGSLDNAYNGGPDVEVDAGPFTLNDATTSTQTTLLITKDGAITGSDSASIFHINSTAAHDTSGTVKFLEISVGSETISTPIGIEIAMNANGDDAILLTKGAMTITDGALTLSSGNFDVTGTGTFSGAVATGALTVTGAVTVSTTLVVTGNTTAGGTLTVDIDSAVAFVVQEEGGTAVLTVDTTQDVGDTSMLLTTKVTTGVGFHIDGSTVTTGDVLKITVAAGTMTSVGAAFAVYDGSTEIFAIRDDGSTVSIKGTAEGTPALTIITGDLTVADGDLIVSAGEVAFTSNANAAGVVLVNNTITTSASFFDVSSTSISTGALARLNANTAAHDGEVLEIISGGDSTSTPVGISVTIASPTTGAARGMEITMVGATTTAKGLAITMDALTTGDMLYLDNGGGTITGDGKYINANDDNTSVFSVAKDGFTSITQLVNSSTGLKIDGIWTSGQALHIDNASGVQAGNTAMIFLDAGGNMADGSNMIRLAPTGTPVEGAVGIEIVGGSKVMQGLVIDSDAATKSANLITGDGIRSADTAVVEIVANVASSNADSQVLRVSQTSATGANVPLAILQADVSEPLILFESTQGSENAIDTTQATAGTVNGSIRVSINGTDHRIALYADDFS